MEVVDVAGRVLELNGRFEGFFVDQIEVAGMADALWCGPA
jgi:hypothetical protein